MSHHIVEVRNLQFNYPDGGMALSGISFRITHGESVAGPNQGPAYAEPVASAVIRIDKPGILVAASYCNIHGLWESFREIDVEA